MDENDGTEERDSRRASALEMHIAVLLKANVVSSLPGSWEWFHGGEGVMESAGEFSSTQYLLFHTQESVSMPRDREINVTGGWRRECASGPEPAATTKVQTR